MIRWAYLKRVLAGAIFGLYIANLLYFLNPQVDITLGSSPTQVAVQYPAGDYGRPDLTIAQPWVKKGVAPCSCGRPTARACCCPSWC